MVVPDTVTTCPLAYFLFIPVCGSVYLFVCACLVPGDAVSGCVLSSVSQMTVHTQTPHHQVQGKHTQTDKHYHKPV